MLQSRLKTYEITLSKPRRKFSVEIFVSRCKIKSLPLLLHQEKLVCSSPPFRFFFFFFSSRFRFWRGASAQKRMSNLVNWMKLRRGRERRLGGEAVFQGNLVLIFYTSRTPRNVSVCVRVCIERGAREGWKNAPLLSPRIYYGGWSPETAEFYEKQGQVYIAFFFSSVSFIRVTFREIRERSFDPLFFVPLNLRRKKKVVQKFWECYGIQSIIKYIR